MASDDDLRKSTKIDGFLKVPDIKGPSTRDGHDEEIEIFNVAFNMVAPFDPNSLSRKGRVALGTVSCSKDVDMSSPYLAKACHENKQFDEVVISCRRTIDGETSDYFVVTMKEAPWCCMMKASGVQQARREASQPSLWDRLVNDLPGLSSEIEALHRALDNELGSERVEAFASGSARAIDSDLDLTPDHKQRLHRLVFLNRNRVELENRGIVVSARVLREAVRRDIEALFNTERFDAVPLLSDVEDEQAAETRLKLDDFPEVRRSVVNFGVPSFSGRSSRDFDKDALAREIKTVLANFEPRLKESATKVTVTLNDKSMGIKIEIDGVLIMTPTPERLRLRTTINLDNGLARTEYGEA